MDLRFCFDKISEPASGGSTADTSASKSVNEAALISSGTRSGSMF